MGLLIIISDQVEPFRGHTDQMIELALMKSSPEQPALDLDQRIAEAENTFAMLTHLILKLSFQEQDASEAEKALGACLERLTRLRLQRAVLPTPIGW